MPRSVVRRAFDPVPAASLAAFRIAFGATLLWEVARYLRYDWVRRYWVEPLWNAPYEGLAWVTPLPEPALFAVMGVLAAAAAALTVGLRPRVAAGAVAV
ncbi:MAG: HTTM domain-containing protein, partial [Trueperaceae bacterium]